MPVTCNWQLPDLEKNGTWSKEWDPSINPVQPTSFEVEPVVDGLRISCAGPKFSGQLAKCVNNLPWQSSLISKLYNVYIDSSIQYGQVIESDTYVTDAAGWTYPGAVQFNIAEGYLVQFGNPWASAGFTVPLQPNQWNGVKIDYAFDYVAHAWKLLAVNGKQTGLTWSPAQQLGWQKSSIVEQLQLCIAGQEADYAVIFAALGYQGSN